MSASPARSGGEVDRELEHWTVEDYRRLDDGQRYEVLRGELVAMSPAPARHHQHVSVGLTLLIAAHVRPRSGRVLHGPVRRRSRRGHRRPARPALRACRTRRRARRWPRFHRGAPDLIVEILSPSTGARDRITKRTLYQEAGVEWLVLIDPEQRSAEVFRLHEGRDVIDDASVDDDTLHIGLFAELDLPLGELWLEPTPPSG